MLAILDSRAPRAICKALEARGHRILAMPPHPHLPSPVCAHPDMLFHFGKHSIFTTKGYYETAKAYLEEIARICHKSIVTTKQEVGDSYPKDVLLNAAELGEHLFCFQKATAREILLEYPEDKILSVRQGYAKCSILPVSERALITQDPSIALVAQKNGFEVLRITPGAIHLPGYDTGLIGGAASAVPYGEWEEIYFCGDLDTHPDGNTIRDFCQAHHKTVTEVKGLPLTDVGTLFFI